MTEMPDQLDLFPEPLVAEYLRLTREEMPRLARSSCADWPVQEDHCFQRIVLDSVCGGVWYDHLARPACRNMTQAQLRQAIALCRDIISDEADLKDLNAQSLVWRGKSLS
jgi:hypothetical protein